MDLSRLQSELVRFLAEIESYADDAYMALVVAACDASQQGPAQQSVLAGYRVLLVKHINLLTVAAEHDVSVARLRYDHLQEYCTLCLSNAIARRLDELALTYVKVAKTLT